jgi:hypothetical protein
MAAAAAAMAARRSSCAGTAPPPLAVIWPLTCAKTVIIGTNPEVEVPGFFITKDKIYFSLDSGIRLRLPGSTPPGLPQPN